MLVPGHGSGALVIGRLADLGCLLRSGNLFRVRSIKSI